MATKDRTALKDEFKNGNLATGERFADLIDSMKVVQLPVVDPQALGTSLSFIDSISQDADGKITATKKTLDLANAHELNPFKGWYKTGDTLPTTGFDGAYLYFKDTSELTGQTTIYRWNGTSYADTGTVVDTSNVQTFETGQAVNEVAVKDIDGNNDQTAAGVLSAEAGRVLAENIFDYEKIDLTATYPEQKYLISGGGTWTIITDTQSRSIMVPVSPGEIYIIEKDENDALIGVLTNNDSPTAGEAVPFATGYSGRISINDSNSPYMLVVPSDGHFLCIRKYNDAGRNLLPILKQKRGTLLENMKDAGGDTIHRLELVPLERYPQRDRIISQNPQDPTRFSFTSVGSATSTMIGVIPGEKYRIERINPDNQAQIALLQLSEYIATTPAIVNTFAHGYEYLIRLTEAEPVIELTIPDDAYFMYVRLKHSSGADMSPKISRVLEKTLNDDVDEFDEEESVGFDQRTGNFNDSPFAYKIDLSCTPSQGTFAAEGFSFLLPVGEEYQLQVGDTLIFKSKDVTPNTTHSYQKVYVSYIDTVPEVGASLNPVDGVIRHTFSDYIVGNKSVIPEGTKYVLIGGTYSATGLDHTPASITRIIKRGGLTVGTFNSSYNELNVSEARKDFCAKLLGRDMPETFLFFTDPHLTENNRYGEITEFVRDKFISALQKYYNSLPLDICICGGDWLNYHDTKADAIAELGYIDGYMRKLFKNYYPVSGNHDNASYKENPHGALLWPPLLPDEIRNAMFRENGKTYYEFNGNKTKFYVLDSGVSFIKEMSIIERNYLNTGTSKYPDDYFASRWGQVIWLAEKLIANDTNNGYSVVIMHWYANASTEDGWFSQPEMGSNARGIGTFGANIKALVTAYNNRDTFTFSIPLGNNQSEGHTYDFTECNGKVLFILSGHTHTDYVDCSGDIPVIATTNLLGGYKDGTVTKYSHHPTFDCCMIDHVGKALLMTRVGTGHSRIVNCEKNTVAVGGTTTLTSKLTGTLTWSVQARYNNIIVSVNNVGVVTGISAGYAGVVATDVNGREEYFIVQCS